MAEGLPLNLPDFAAVHESGYGRYWLQKSQIARH